MNEIIGSAAISTRSVIVRNKYTPNLKALTLILKTKYLNISAPLTNPSVLWSHKEFRTDLPLVLFVSGWQTDLLVQISTAQETMFEAYACRGNVNFVVIFQHKFDKNKLLIFYYMYNILTFLRF